MIKPNVASWRGIQVANIGEVGRKVSSSGNRYGLDSVKVDSHAMKNDEWASVAYLSQSKYGKLGNSSFSGANKKIYFNKSDQLLTGCSYGSPSDGASNYGCQYTYNIAGSGTGASTTGTIYGVYDMSGGSWEIVLGNYNHYSGYTSKSYTKEEAAELGSTDGQEIKTPLNSGYTGKCGLDNLTFTGKNWLDAKYYNFYTTEDINTACNGHPCYSHALQETKDWESESSNMVSSNYPWFSRGNSYMTTNSAGIFRYTYRAGSVRELESFRLVLASL